MKYGYLSIILLILIFSVGAVCAQDNATDIISAGSDDVISIAETPILQDNGSSVDEIHINDANFNQYFDENNTTNDNVSADSTIFIGEITNKSLFINKPLTVIPDEDSKIMDSSITFISGSDGSTMYGLTFNNTCGDGAIFVIEAENIAVLDNIISIVSNINETGPAILALNANNFTATANTITYTGKSDGDLQSRAMVIIESENATIEDNKFEISIPSMDVDWNATPSVPRSVGIHVTNSSGISFKRNEIYLNATDVFGEFDTVYVVDIVDSDNAQFDENKIEALGHKYIYGLVISGKYFDVIGNSFSIVSDSNYANGIDVESNSDGLIKDNEFNVTADSVYAIYTANWGGDVKVNITNNIINACGTNVFGMYLTGSESLVEDNIVNTSGNFTTSISSAVNNISIIKNTIIANATNVFIPTGNDSTPIKTFGVQIVNSDNATVSYNNITSTGKYGVFVEGNTAVTDNEIRAEMLTGDFAVDYYQHGDAHVANNTPAMELTYKLTNDTFFIYFDESGEIREQIDADNLTFIGPFSNLVHGIQIGRPIKLLSDNATLIDIPILIAGDNVTIDGFKLINNQSATILAFESKNITVMNNEINVIGSPDTNNAAIAVGECNGVLIYNNDIKFNVETNETFRNMAIFVSESDDVSIIGNTINASLPARSVDWGSGTIYSQGVFLDGCDEAVLECNHIAVISNNQTGTYDSIYAVNIKGNNATLIGNEIGAVEAPYGYAILISGVNFNIYNNTIFAGENGTYACGIEVDGPSNGIIESNNIYAIANDSAYGVYTSSWTGDVRTEIISNYVNVSSNSPFAMSLTGSESFVENNNITANGNYTTGIASTVEDMIIADNKIIANGSNVGTPAGYDTMGIETTGVHIVSGDAIVVNINITTTGEFTVDFEGTGKVVDNYLVASEYTGDASVNYNPDQEIVVEDNVPVMQRAIVTADDVVMYYKNGTRYVILLTDQNGNALANETVTITLNGVSYKRTTNENGTASIAINLPSGNYTASVLYEGKDNFTNTSSENNVTVLTTIFGNDVVKTFRNGTQYYATFIDGQGNPLANTNVTFNINGVFYTRQTNASGQAKLNINLEQGEYIITAFNPENGEEHANNITVLPLIQSNDLVKYFRNESQFVVTIFGDDGNPVGAGENVTFNINGVFYTRQTNASGQVKLNINLPQGNYTITTMYKGCNVANNIEVLPILYAEDLVMKQGTSDQFRAKLVDGQGNPYSGQNITFNIHGIFYQRTTDDGGWAALNIKLSAAADTYVITSMYNECTISNKIIIEPA